MNEPTQINAGDYVTWTETPQDYPASQGWQLSYNLVNVNGNMPITSTPSGDSFIVALDYTTTKNWIPGSYAFISYVTKGTDKRIIFQSNITVNPNLIDSVNYVNTTHAFRMLSAIEAVAEGRATKAQMHIQIAGRAMQFIPPDELRKLRNEYKAQVIEENRKALQELGKPTGKKILIGF